MSRQALASAQRRVAKASAAAGLLLGAKALLEETNAFLAGIGLRNEHV